MSAGLYCNMIEGSFTIASLNSLYPASPELFGRAAYVSNRVGGAGNMICDGVGWVIPAAYKRIDTYTGTTDASGNLTITYPTVFPASPHVNPVTKPPADSITRVRVTAESVSGCTIKSEKNATVNLLRIDILGIGTANVAGVPVGVLVAG